MYSSLEEALLDLEAHGQLVRISGVVDPYLEAAEIHRRVFAAHGPAILFEKIRGSQFRAASNIFGSWPRCEFLFRHTLKDLKNLIALKYDPKYMLHSPWRCLKALTLAPYALPRHLHRHRLLPCLIQDLPQITSWPADGGAFITLPQVFSEDPRKPGIMNANLGMYRIQISGGHYLAGQEIGLHYQLHRTIGQHHSSALALGKNLKVSIFVGGPPAHTLAAIMPLPDNLSETLFAGLLGKRRFRYSRFENQVISADADFVLTGEIIANTLKPEGPFGDHLGYYSLEHPMPVVKINHVLAKKNAIWPFTVVGRPPAEDSFFGQLVHEIAGSAVKAEIPGVTEIHAVDAAGVHPLMLAKAYERYVPYEKRQPREMLTAANAILGFGQASLSKYLFLAAQDETQNLDIHDVRGFFTHILERIDFARDLHFQTRTTMDTLDYSGTGLNEGSKLVLVAVGEKRRNLSMMVPSSLPSVSQITSIKTVSPGILAVQIPAYVSSLKTQEEMDFLSEFFARHLNPNEYGLLVMTEDAEFLAAHYDNFLWTTFTRSNPSHDVYGVKPFNEFKHWGCLGPLIIDARKKPHHAPELVVDKDTKDRVDKLFVRGGVLEKWG